MVMFDHHPTFEDNIEVDYLAGSCQCGWAGSAMFYVGDRPDLAKAEEKLRQKHSEEERNCELTPRLAT